MFLYGVTKFSLHHPVIVIDIRFYLVSRLLVQVSVGDSA